MVALLSTVLWANANAATTQDSLRTTIFFRTGYSQLDLSYRNNAAKLEALVEGIRDLQSNPDFRLQNIRIISAASPEGNSAFNKRVAEKRGERLRDYLMQTLMLPDRVYAVSSVGEDWDGLAKIIARENVPWRDKALSIIKNTPEWVVKNGKVVDGRKRQLQNLNGGKAWKYLLDKHFYTLRSGAVVICEVQKVEKPEPPAVVEPEVVPPSAEIPAPQEPADTEPVPTGKNAYLALKTNLLYDAALVPNIGIEASLGKGWTIGATGMFAWWSNADRHRYWRVYGGGFDVRKYFGAKAKEKPLQGHHIGLYGQFLTYDLEKGNKGFQSKATYVGGLEYGYSYPIAKRLNLDFGLGIGFIRTDYKTYLPKEGCYVYQASRRRNWIGPSQAEISLVWLIGKGNTNSKKGGAK